MKKLALILCLLATPAFAQGDSKPTADQPSKKPTIEELQAQLKQARSEVAGYQAMADTFRGQAQSALDQLAKVNATAAMQKAAEAK